MLSCEICNGCAYQKISYADELALKKAALEKTLGIGDIEIIPSPSIIGYKNKMEFSFGDTGIQGELALGLRKKRSFYEVVIPYDCNIIDDDYKLILFATLDYFKGKASFYHRKKNYGYLRHLVIRKGKFTGELFVNLVTTDESFDLSEWVNLILTLPLDGKIAGAANTINLSPADAIRADKFILLCGRDYFYEKLLGLRFKISPFSFFQTNSAGAEVLYSVVKNFVPESGLVFDLYCGTGTIAQILAAKAGRAVGVEIVPEAVAAARESAELNGIANCEFIAADVLSAAGSLQETPDAIVLDPPRSGIHPKAIGKIMDFHADYIVYVSCKAESLARDMKILSERYALQNVTGVDMFPRTAHVECVALLSRK